MSMLDAAAPGLLPDNAAAGVGVGPAVGPTILGCADGAAEMDPGGLVGAG
jgi:hypothetical protein